MSDHTSQEHTPHHLNSLSTRLKAHMRRLTPPLIAAVAFCVLWEDITRLLALPSYLLPAPSAVLSSLGERLPDGRLMVSFLLSATIKTALSAFVGFLCAAVLGVLMGTTLASVRLLRVGVYPLANLLQMVPIIALAPLLNIWFGYGLAGVAAAACIVSIFPVIANTVDGLRSTDPQLVELFEVYGASRAQRWRRLELPAALPQIFTGLRIAAGLAVIGAVVGELVSGVLDDPPIGAVIATNLRTGRLEVVFASILGSASVGFGLFGLVSWAGERALGSWHASTQRARVDEVSTTPAQARRERHVLLIAALALAALTAWAWRLPAQGSEAARAQAQAQAQAQNPQDPATAGEPIKVTLQLNWMPEPEFGGLYAAQHYGYDREEGIALELVSGGPGVPSAQLIASGAVDFGVLGAAQVVSMRAKGADLIALYASFQETPRVLMAHAEGAPASLEGLWTSGRLMAIEPGATFVRWLNQRYGAGGVRVVASQGGLSQFKQNKALTQAAYVFSEPVTLGLEGLPTKLYRVSESGWNPYEVVVAGREAYVRAHPQRAQALARAVRRGWVHYLRDPREVNALLARLNPSMSFEAMQAASLAAEPFVRGELTPREPTGELPLGEMSLERWRTLSEQLKSLGVVQNPDAPERLFYRF